MLIVCPSCACSYDIGLESLSPNGRQVRCVRCRSVWHAQPNHADRLVAAAAAIGPDDETGAPDDGNAEAVVAQAPDHEFEDAGARFEPAAADRCGDVAAEPSVNGELGTVEAPPIAPVDFERQPAIEIDGEYAPAPAEDIETVAARRQRRNTLTQALRWPLSHVQTAILVLALANVFLVGWRASVVRALPQTASLYAMLGMPVNLRGVTFEDVATAMEQHEGVPILVVEGNVFNGARKTEDVPRLKFIVRNAARQEIYSWTAVPTRGSLQPGEAVAFRTRLASPPPDTRDVIVRFLNRHDLIAGAR
jgi:predicted Zn finger-like uncharacterized protein